MFLLVNNDSFILAVKSVQLNKPKYNAGAMKTGAKMIIVSVIGLEFCHWCSEPNPSHIMLWLARSLVLDTPYFSLKHHPVANPSLISHLLGELVLFLLLSHSFRFLSQPGSPSVSAFYVHRPSAPLTKFLAHLHVVLISSHTHTRRHWSPNTQASFTPL